MLPNPLLTTVLVISIKSTEHNYVKRLEKSLRRCIAYPSIFQNQERKGISF